MSQVESCRATSYHLSCHAVSCHVMSHDIMSCHAMACRFLSHQVKLSPERVTHPAAHTGRLHDERSATRDRRDTLNKYTHLQPHRGKRERLFHKRKDKKRQRLSRSPVQWTYRTGTQHCSRGRTLNTTPLALKLITSRSGRVIHTIAALLWKQTSPKICVLLPSISLFTLTVTAVAIATRAVPFTPRSTPCEHPGAAALQKASAVRGESSWRSWPCHPSFSCPEHRHPPLPQRRPKRRPSY